MDTITLKSLKFSGKHGYYDEERQKGNHFELDVIASGDFQPATYGDNLKLTFNYETVQSVAKEVFDGPSEKLIETLCKRIGDKIFEKAPIVHELTVSLRKMDPPIDVPADYAEITMTWNR